MLNETYIRNLTNIVNTATNKDEIIERVVYLTNDLKNDIAQAIKEKGMNSGRVDFVAVPEAIKIISDGGIPTDDESLELAIDYISDGDGDKAIELLKGLKGSLGK